MLSETPTEVNVQLIPGLRAGLWAQRSTFLQIVLRPPSWARGSVTAQPNGLPGWGGARRSGWRGAHQTGEAPPTAGRWHAEPGALREHRGCSTCRVSGRPNSAPARCRLAVVQGVEQHHPEGVWQGLGHTPQQPLGCTHLTLVGADGLEVGHYHRVAADPLGHDHLVTSQVDGAVLHADAGLALAFLAGERGVTIDLRRHRLRGDVRPATMLVP